MPTDTYPAATNDREVDANIRDRMACHGAPTKHTAECVVTCTACGKPLHDSYVTRQNGDKLHLSCANPNRVERDHRTEAAADRAEREIERRFS